MKTLSVWAMALCLAVSGCKKSDDSGNVTPAAPDYLTAIQAKYKALGWAEGADNGGAPEKTAGGKGFVQYYGNKNRAIYYFDGKAFDALKNEMAKYDVLGQDKFAVITEAAGYLVVKKVDGTGDGLIITTPNVGCFMVYGEIYRKYNELNRWEGPLGYPTNDESDLSSKKGRFNTFTKGQIYWGASTGAQAFWGKVDQMYGKAGFDGGWLGLPKTSCDLNVADNAQQVAFQNGQILINAGCGKYKNSSGKYAFVSGSGSEVALLGDTSPCY